MKKIIYNNIDINMHVQDATKVSNIKCLSGIISQTTDGFLFEETIRKGRPPRNPKVFDGKYVSMVRKSDGKYQMHMKTIPEGGFDLVKLPFYVYVEVADALKIMMSN